MKITDIMSYSDSFTDEVCSEEWARAFVNQAIGLINVTLQVSLPLLDSSASEYVATILPDDYQNILFVPYVCYGVKMNDTSLNEADRYLNMFNTNLTFLKSNLSTVIPPEYQDPSGNGEESTIQGKGGVYQIDTSNAINMGWFGPGTSTRGGN